MILNRGSIAKSGITQNPEDVSIVEDASDRPAPTRGSGCMCMQWWDGFGQVVGREAFMEL